MSRCGLSPWARWAWLGPGHCGPPETGTDLRQRTQRSSRMADPQDRPDNTPDPAPEPPLSTPAPPADTAPPAPPAKERLEPPAKKAPASKAPPKKAGAQAAE